MKKIESIKLYKIKMISLIIIICLFMSSFLFVGITEAWFLIGSKKDDITITLGDFDAAALPKINDTSLYQVDSVYNSTDKLFVLNGVTKSKYTPEEQVGEYFVEDLNIDIIIKNDIAAYVRVKVITEWELTRTYTRIQRDPVVEAVYVTDQFPYNLALNQDNESDWFYDGNTDYVYYKNIISKGENTINFITGGTGYNTSSSRNFIETCDAIIGIEVEIVQANRWKAIWGIEGLPWEVSNEEN